MRFSFSYSKLILQLFLPFCKLNFTFSIDLFTFNEKTMKSRQLLLSNSYKKLGWWIFVPSLILGLFFMIASELPFNPTIRTFGLFGNELLSKSHPPLRFGEIELIPNLIILSLLIGGLLVMFSKQKKEDEFINHIRLVSMQFSVFINYSLLFFCSVFIHGIPFLHVMIYNLFTVMLIYILRFHFLIFKNSQNSNE